MNGIQSSLYTVAIAWCAFGAGLLRSRRTPAGLPLSWLTVFLGIGSAVFALELLMIHPATPLKGLWLGLRLGGSLLIAPCLWLVIRETVEGVRPRLADLGRGHAAAVLAGFVLLVPLIAGAHLGTAYRNPLSPASPAQARLIQATMLGCIAIFAVQVPYCLWRCHRLLLGHASAPRWLNIPLLVVFTAWLLGLLRTLQCIAHTPQAMEVFVALVDVGVMVGATWLLVKRAPAPGWTGAPVDAATAPSATEAIPVTAGPAEPAAAVAAKYARSPLDAALRDRIRRKLETALAGEEVYRDSLLSLRSLSAHLHEKAHYVSQVINQDLGTTFYELVNRHRIERAGRLLVEQPDRTVLEVALAVGFNSKSTFNLAFRRITGRTPSDYRDAARRAAGPDA